VLHLVRLSVCTVSPVRAVPKIYSESESRENFKFGEDMSLPAWTQLSRRANLRSKGDENVEIVLRAYLPE